MSCSDLPSPLRPDSLAARREARSMVFAQFALGEVFISMVWFFLFVLWFMLLFRVFADIFRDHELSGVSKALWLIFVIVLPYLGVFVYLIARGHSMAGREVNDAQAREQQFQEYVRSAAGTDTSPSAELARI